MPSDPPSSPPSAADLHQAALHYLARYAATEAGLRRILSRRIDRWARSQPEASEDLLDAARAAVEPVISRLVQAGALSDAAFAEMRARSLLQGGRSRRSIQARLVAKGVASDLARDATPDDPEAELGAALVMARRRRIGPYRAAAEADAVVKLKELGRLARAGFSRETAQRALDMTAEEAEQRIHELRR